MNIAEVSIRCKTVTLVMTLVVVMMGIVSYGKLGRLEDPEFTIKDAQIFTRYPGATAAEVAAEVTDDPLLYSNGVHYHHCLFYLVSSAILPRHN